MEKDLAETEIEFAKTIDPGEQEVRTRINEVIGVLDTGPGEKGFSSWGIDKLISAKEKLSRYSETLGEWIGYHQLRADFAYIWRKGKMASDWGPTKAKLSKELGKLTNPEIESYLTERYLKEQFYSMFHQRKADELILLMEASDRIIRSIDARLRELQRQYSITP